MNGRLQVWRSAVFGVYMPSANMDKVGSNKNTVPPQYGVAPLALCGASAEMPFYTRCLAFIGALEAGAYTGHNHQYGQGEAIFPSARQRCRLLIGISFSGWCRAGTC